MNKSTVKIICDSVNPLGERITTFELTYWRAIHAELMTYRMASRNAASSRAIPVEKMIAQVEGSEWGPEFWAANQSGMAASAEVEDPTAAIDMWRVLKREAMNNAEILQRLGLHKAIVSRVLEPFNSITTVFTIAERSMANLVRQRCHPAAQQEFQALAHRMLSQYLTHEPVPVKWNGWHLPYVDEADAHGWPSDSAVQVSTARCARVSFLQQDGSRLFSKDFELYEKLRANGHWSPFEHPCQAQAQDPGRLSKYQVDTGCHDVVGWVPHRVRTEPESKPMTRSEMETICAARPAWIQL